ncbi:MAG TPA: minor capsid protein, partial [Burkholderiales bacterium]|nr:minor capsid protein [Burkholderiales bacterium]
ELATNLATVLDAKRKGNSADFVQAIGADDDIQINVIGAKGEVLQIESPAMHFVEQILAKMPLPGWMVGLTEAQAGRMADQQSEIVLMESKTRFENRLPALNAVVTTWLRSEGIAWKPGDWAIVQDLPNLRDIMKQAQARFLNAQADMMQHTLTDNPQTPTGVTAAMGGDPNSAKFSRIVVRNKSDGSVETEFFPRARAPRVHVHSKGGGENADDESEPWAEDDDTLPGLEAAAVDGTLALWDTFRESALRTLGVTENAGDGAARFRFDAATMLQPLLDDEQAFIDAAGAENGPLIRNAFAAFLRGVENAASDLDVESTLDNARDTLRADLVARDLRLVKDGSVRAFHDGVLEGLQSGIYDGKNPATVADELAQRFDAGNYNWTRLARSEIAAAQGAGKAAQFKALGVQQVDFMTAGGACPICQDLEDGGPYDIDQAPKPVDDSHPQCRCTLVAVVSEKRLRAIQQKSTRRTTNPEKGADLG